MKNVHFAIPEIYGDSLSYYEVLRELIKAMNVMIDNYDTIPEQIAEAVKNLDASQLFSEVLNQLIHSIATDNTKSANAVKVYKKHDLLYATFNDTVNLYESLIDFSTGTTTELILGTNIREVNISELFIELRKLIDINKNNIEAVKAVANENRAEIATMHNDITSIENKNTEQDNEISTLRTMISSPYNFKGDVASISALPASGQVNDTYYVQDVKYKVTWTGSAWVQSSLSEADYQTELSELKSDLVNLTGNEFLSYKTNTYIDLSGNTTDFSELVSDEGYNCYVENAVKGDTFTITGQSGDAARGYCFTDASGNVLLKSKSRRYFSNETLVAPEGTAKIIVHLKPGNSFLCRGELIKSKVNEVNSKVKEIVFDYSGAFNGKWVIGGFSQSGGYDNSKWKMRTEPINVSNKTYFTITPLYGYTVYARICDYADGDYVPRVNYSTKDEDVITLNLDPNDYLIIIIVANGGAESPVDTNKQEYYCNIEIKRIGIQTQFKKLNQCGDLIETLFSPYKFKPQAHRGLSDTYTQNTLEAFEESAKIDYVYGIETDVQQTSDGVLVCYHDGTLDTLTTGTGQISSYTYEQLQSFYYKGTNKTIPKFEDYLKICRKYGKVPYIELKILTYAGVDDTLKMVEKLGFCNRCVFTSFNHGYLKRIRAKTDNYIIEFMHKANATDYDTIIETIKQYKNACVRLYCGNITEEIVNKFHENKLLVDSWGLSVSDSEMYEKLIDIGVEGCTCNNFLNFTIY